MVFLIYIYIVWVLKCTMSSAGISNTAINVAGIDAICPSSKEDFVELEKLLKEKICQFEKSVHYSNFLDSLFRELCISCKFHSLYQNLFICMFLYVLCTKCHGFPPARFVLSNPFWLTVEIEDLKKISNALTVLLSEKQKQEKVSNFIFILGKYNFWEFVFIQQMVLWVYSNI